MIMMGDKRKALTAILGPYGEEESKAEPGGELKAIAQEFIECVLNHDVEGVAEAFKAAFQLCDSEPHVEGEHID